MPDSIYFVEDQSTEEGPSKNVFPMPSWHLVYSEIQRSKRSNQFKDLDQRHQHCDLQSSYKSLIHATLFMQSLLKGSGLR